MKLGADNETLAENKVLILYLLQTIDKPINNDGLYRLVLSIQDMNYFYFQQFLIDLENDKYISRFQKEEAILYQITENGKNTLNLTIDLLPGIIKLKIDKTIKGELKEIKDENVVRAEFIPLSEKEFIVKCKLMEDNNKTFEIQTFATSREQAVRIVKNWEENASKIYPTVLQMLNEEIEKEEPKIEENNIFDMESNIRIEGSQN